MLPSFLKNENTVGGCLGCPLMMSRDAQGCPGCPLRMSRDAQGCPGMSSRMSRCPRCHPVRMSPFLTTFPRNTGWISRYPDIQISWMSKLMNKKSYLNSRFRVLCGESSLIFLETIQFRYSMLLVVRQYDINTWLE